MPILFDMEFKINNCKIIITPLFVVFLCLILLVDKTGIMLFGLLSAFVHELGHIVFIKLANKKIDKISFQLGGILIDCKGIVGYKKEFLIALGGCLFNFCAFFILALIYFFTHNELILLFCATNFGLFAFNLSPVYGLDGMDLIKIIFFNTFETVKANIYCKIISCCFISVLLIVTLFLLIYKKNFTLFFCLLYLIILMLMFLKK